VTSQGLRFELRDQTQKAHKRLDAALIKHDLTTVSGLSAYLSVHYLAGKHLETITLEPDCHKDISRKISAIEADLDLLSVSSPDWKAAPQARNCHPLGLTYVIAGSALGSKLFGINFCLGLKRRRPKKLNSMRLLKLQTIVLVPDWLINHASKNVSELLSLESADVIGTPASDVLTPDAIHTIRTKLQLLSGTDALERIFGIQLTKKNMLFDVAIHISGRSIILEFEKHMSSSRQDYSSYVRPMMKRIEVAKSTQELCDVAARQLRALTDFDRVMVYKFEDNGSGTVVSESLKGKAESFKGLRYPASDIPKQARALYKRNLLRIIADATDDGFEIVPHVNPEGLPLDLSMSAIRAVSPVHLEYLRNMGVGASQQFDVTTG